MADLSEKHIMFRNRLLKVHRHLSKLARRQGVSCYRLYDRDLPEFPLIIEVYGSRVYLAEYQSHHQLSEDAYALWWSGCVEVVKEVLQVSGSDIFQKTRKRKAGRNDQYQKFSDDENFFVVEENGLKFWVNLSDYIDTGLFLDHRMTRQMVREQSPGKRVLNLFCYTGSFSVYAASGGARQVVSVDLSNTYLNWAQRNFQVNGLNEPGSYSFIKADVLRYLQEVKPGSFDIVILDPPTFSNSKMMEGFLDIQRDHVTLINDCLHVLDTGGILYFSTNLRKFILEREGIESASITDITKATTPFDFAGKLQRWCYRIQK